MAKVLRIGIIQSGKIIEERRLLRREAVTLGPSGSFQVGVGRNLTLFELEGELYLLRFSAAMSGRIQLRDGGPQELSALRETAARRGDDWCVALDDSARGKVVIGDVTVLFQLVDPPLAEERAVLPRELRGTLLSNLDFQFSALMVASAIVCASVAAYARTVPYAEPTIIEEIDPAYRTLIMPNPLPEPEVAPQVAGAEQPAKPAPARPPSGPRSGGPSGGPRRAAPDVRHVGLIEAIGVAGRHGGAVHDLFDGELDEHSISEALAGAQGLAFAGDEKPGAHGSRLGGGGDGSTDIGHLDTDIQDARPFKPGEKPPEKAPPGDIRVDPPKVNGGLTREVVEREMRSRIKALKSCYDSELKRYPALAGKLILAFAVDGSGRVLDIDFPEDTLRSNAVSSCIAERVKHWRFPEPEKNSGDVAVEFPLIFEPGR